MNKLYILLAILMMAGCSGSANRDGSDDIGISSGTDRSVSSGTDSSVSTGSISDSTSTLSDTTDTNLSCAQLGQNSFANWLNTNPGADFGMDIILFNYNNVESYRWNNLVYPIADTTKNVWVSKLALQSKGLFLYDIAWRFTGLDSVGSNESSGLDFDKLTSLVNITIKNNNCPCGSSGKLTFDGLPFMLSNAVVAASTTYQYLHFGFEWDTALAPSNICVTAK